jgi:hypothetical protein
MAGQHLKENELNKIPVKNNTDMPMYVGASMVLPGETRHFEAHEVPSHLKPQAEEVQPEEQLDPLVELIASSVKDVAAQLPALSIEQIKTLGDLERAGAARKTLLLAIAEELLRRAGNESELAAMSNAELTATLEASLGASEEDVDAAFIAALQAEVARRAAV